MPTSQTIEYPTLVLPATTPTSQSQQRFLNASSRSSSRSSLNPATRPFTQGSLRGSASIGAMGTIDSARTSVTQVGPYDETMFLQEDSTDGGRVDLAALGLVYEGMVPPTSHMSEVPGPSQLPQSSSMANGRLSPIPASPALTSQDAPVSLSLAPPLGHELAPLSLPAEHQTQSTTSLLPQQRHEHELQHPQTPQTYLTFLLISGQRKIMSFDPETTIGRVKELVWNAWPGEWQQHPPSPSYLRILYLGKMLQDDDTLTTLKIPLSTPPSSPTRSSPPPHPPSTIVHLSIKPFGAPGDGGDYAIKKKWGRPRSGDLGPPATRDENTCCCVIC